MRSLTACGECRGPGEGCNYCSWDEQAAELLTSRFSRACAYLKARQAMFHFSLCPPQPLCDQPEYWTRLCCSLIYLRGGARGLSLLHATSPWEIRQSVKSARSPATWSSPGSSRPDNDRKCPHVRMMRHVCPCQTELVY
jgi:hypothetical protein